MFFGGNRLRLAIRRMILHRCSACSCSVRKKNSDGSWKEFHPYNGKMNLYNSHQKNGLKHWQIKFPMTGMQAMSDCLLWKTNFAINKKTTGNSLFICLHWLIKRNTGTSHTMTTTWSTKLINSRPHFVNLDMIEEDRYKLKSWKAQIKNVLPLRSSYLFNAKLHLLQVNNCYENLCKKNTL